MGLDPGLSPSCEAPPPPPPYTPVGPTAKVNAERYGTGYCGAGVSGIAGARTGAGKAGRA